MSTAIHGARFTLAVMLAACGPQSAEPVISGSSGGTTTGPAATSGTGEVPTSGGPATSDSTGPGSTGSTGSTGESAASSTGVAASSSGGSSTGDGVLPCGSAEFCEENEHCTPEARQNAEVTGATPLGVFAGTFGFASAALALGDLGTLYVMPEYMTDICGAAPQLRLELGPATSADFMVEAPIVIDDGQGQTAAAVAVVHITNCCNALWFCACASPSPYEVEFSVEGGGWSLVGKARPNCCRSYSIDEAA